MTHEFKFELGQKAEDIVTGFKGIITSRVQHITGCDTYGIKPKVNKNGAIDDAVWFDENSIKIIGKGIKIDVSEKAEGGPREHPKG